MSRNIRNVDKKVYKNCESIYLVNINNDEIHAALNGLSEEIYKLHNI